MRYSDWSGFSSHVNVPPQPPEKPLLERLRSLADELGLSGHTSSGRGGYASPVPPFFGGVQVYEIHAPVPTRTYQARTHRKRRINKKCRKRFGFKTVVDREQADKFWMVGDNKVYCYPHMYQKLKQSIDAMNSTQKRIAEDLNYRAMTAPVEGGWLTGVQSRKENKG